MYEKTPCTVMEYKGLPLAEYTVLVLLPLLVCVVAEREIHEFS